MVNDLPVNGVPILKQTQISPWQICNWLVTCGGDCSDVQDQLRNVQQVQAID